MDENTTSSGDYSDSLADENGLEVAVIGMAGRFAGAADVDQFWDNLRNGVESISFFTDQELLASGTDPKRMPPNFVNAGGVIEGTDLFDAAFFRYSPREAKTMGPQHRMMLEYAYLALQNAGYDAQRYSGAIGVFAGESSNSYTRLKQFAAASGTDSFNDMQIAIGNDRDFLSTAVSYKMNLKGPSLTIQSSCSTSLVAVHVAYQSLLAGECDIALAGGITLRIPQKTGYLYQKEGIMSSDGHCRAFDAAAEGTVGGEGVGVVTLKRLEDARADGDCIHAIIRGSALNNDGSNKVGYTAPSVEGQADVIARAQAMGGIEPDSIAYIETHGTGTLLGDPIEMTALTRAFRSRGSQNSQYCAVGSVKTNIGHLDAAAGIAGLIKAVLVLKNRQIPPSLNYHRANPQIDFANSPFYVSQELTDWKSTDRPFRAGVSSFGIGGSNVHMVLQEPPPVRSIDRRGRTAKLLLLSAATESALETASDNLVAHLRANSNQALADVAFTLQVGRQQLQQRRFLVSDDREDAIAALDAGEQKRVLSAACADETRSVVFMFPGQGSQHIDMGRQLYEAETVFRAHFDSCCELVKPDIGIDLRQLLYPGEGEKETMAERLNQTAFTQPALFAVEYALAQLWLSWGVRPQAMIGHSIGEYVAACLAEVFSLADALSLVSARARLMQKMPEGSMTAVPMPADEIESLLGDGLALAAINEPSMCVVSGATAEVTGLEDALAKQGVECRRLHTSHAFHSEMMQPVIQPFEDLLREIKIGKPKIPYISNLTGTWVSAEEISNPSYWGRHLRNTVRFAPGLELLFENQQTLFLEVGPGQVLSTLLRRNPSKKPDHLVIQSMRHPQNTMPDDSLLLTSLGRLWLAGIEVDWAAFHNDDPCRRVPLPGYPFERKRFWIEDEAAVARVQPKPAAAEKNADLGNWFYVPGWKSAMAPLLKLALKIRDGHWLVFSDGSGRAEKLISSLMQAGREVVVVEAGSAFSRMDNNRYMLRPAHPDDMLSLVRELNEQGMTPGTVLYTWSMASPGEGGPAEDAAQLVMNDFYDLLNLARALVEEAPSVAVELIVVASGTQAVNGSEVLHPYRAALYSLSRVIPQEQDRISCRMIDIEAPGRPGYQELPAENLFAEIGLCKSEQVVALRHNGRWVQEFEAVFLDRVTEPLQRLRQCGVYLITGGFGNIGMVLAQYLAQAVGARLILVGRSEFPARESWDEQLASSGKDSAIGRKILAVRALEESGAEVFAASADVADEEQMRAVVEQASDRFGQINGVIHAAVANDQQSFQLFRDLDRQACELQFIPKIRGLEVLDRVLEGQTPDFCIIMSSVASMLGGLRFAAYASSNALLDAFAQSRHASASLPWLSVNWDAWQFADNESGSSSAVARFAMTAEEGVDAFTRILTIPSIPQLVVSTWDLQARLDQWIKRPGEMKSDDAAGAGSTPGETRQQVITEVDFTPRGIERRLLDIWSDLLGVDGIDVDDNFFELGGDSLFALQVTSRLREALIVDLSAASIMEAPTIAELTRHILEQQQSSDDDTKASELLQQIREISPEEKQKLLAEARKAQGIAK